MISYRSILKFGRGMTPVIGSIEAYRDVMRETGDRDKACRVAFAMATTHTIGYTILGIAGLVLYYGLSGKI